MMHVYMYINIIRRVVKNTKKRKFKASDITE